VKFRRSDFEEWVCLFPEREKQGQRESRGKEEEVVVCCETKKIDHPPGWGRGETGGGKETITMPKNESVE